MQQTLESETALFKESNIRILDSDHDVGRNEHSGPCRDCTTNGRYVIGDEVSSESFQRNEQLGWRKIAVALR